MKNVWLLASLLSIFIFVFVGNVREVWADDGWRDWLVGYLEYEDVDVDVQPTSDEYGLEIQGYRWDDDVIRLRGTRTNIDQDLLIRVYYEESERPIRVHLESNGTHFWDTEISIVNDIDEVEVYVSPVDVVVIEWESEVLRKG